MTPAKSRVIGFPPVRLSGDSLAWRPTACAGHRAEPPSRHGREKFTLPTSIRQEFRRILVGEARSAADGPEFVCHTGRVIKDPTLASMTAAFWISNATDASQFE
jgi:hypothetical protein